MKYLLAFATFGLGVLAQNIVEPVEAIDNSVVLSKQLVNNKEGNEILIFKDPLYEKPDNTADWASIDHGFNEPEPRPESHRPSERKQGHQRKHHKKQHRERQTSDHNILVDPIDGWKHESKDQEGNFIPGPQVDQQWREDQDHEENDGSNCKSHKKFWKGKGKKIGHVVFFVILAIISIFLVKKCMKKRQDRIRQRQSRNQNISNPVSIDDQINKHYAEIQRLTEMKNSIQRQARVEPIIYHQAYSQEVQMAEMSHNMSRGRMINENSYPIVQPHNIEYQNIPVGRPVTMNNPYSHQQIYRANQY